jgi:hypothetical protein
MGMGQLFLNFYRSFYLRTGGFIPCKPLNRTVYPGDFFQVRKGEIVVLGNIFRNGIIIPKDATLKYGIKLDPAAWQLNNGITMRYTNYSNDNLPDSEIMYRNQVLEFAEKGSFGFKAHQPEAVRIMNWSELQQQLIIKLTQTIYSFRELYVVTETAAASDWVLAISGAEKAKLEMTSEVEDIAFDNFFDRVSAKAMRMKNIDFFHHEKHRKPIFFKAKKLAVQDERMEVFISELIYQQLDWNHWISSFYSPDLYHDPLPAPHVAGHTQINVLDMLQAGELNPNTALQYFKWTDATLDDVEQLFANYGYEL